MAAVQSYKAFVRRHSDGRDYEDLYEDRIGQVRYEVRNKIDEYTDILSQGYYSSENQANSHQDGLVQVGRNSARNFRYNPNQGYVRHGHYGGRNQTNGYNSRLGHGRVGQGHYEGKNQANSCVCNLSIGDNLANSFGGSPVQGSYAGHNQAHNQTRDLDDDVLVYESDDEYY